MCSLDLSKALDKMNHHGLFIKLMERHLPNIILSILERWFAISVTCVKWCNKFQRSLTCHVACDKAGYCRRTMFACFIDSVVDKVKSSGVGCYVNI